MTSRGGLDELKNKGASQDLAEYLLALESRIIKLERGGR
jgi:hypothetical protein